MGRGCRGRTEIRSKRFSFPAAGEGWIRQEENAHRGNGMKKGFAAYLGKLCKEYLSNEKKGVFFTKMLLWYAVSTVVVFLVFGTVMSISIQRDYRNQISLLNERAISQSVSACTTTLRNLYNYYYLEVLESPDLIELLLAQEYSADLTMNYKRLRTMLVNYSDMVESCYVVNLKNGFVCSTLDTYQHIEDFSDRDILEWLELIQDMPGEYALVPRQAAYSVGGLEYTRRYISLILKKYKEGYLVVNLDYEAFADMVNYRDYGSSSRALLISSSGLVLADSGEERFGETVREEEFYLYMKEQKGKDGAFTVRLKDGRKNLLYCKDQTFGISYLILTDEPLLGGNALLFQMIFCAMGAVALNLLLIVIGTCFLYRPIGRLQRLFLTAAGKDAELRVDEFEAMERIFNRLWTDNREYSRSRRKQMLRELLDDRKIGGALFDKERELAKEQMDGVFFLCVNLYPNENEPWTPDDFLLMKFCMENILRELLEKDAVMETVDYGSYVTCVISRNASAEGPERFGGEKPMEAVEGPVGEEPAEDAGSPVGDNTGAGKENPILSALEEMQRKMEEFFGVDVTCSVGSVVGSLDDIAESYEEAMVAAFFQMTRERNAILYNGAGADTDGGGQSYPGDTVKEILDGIRTGDKGKIRREVSDFYAALMSASYHQAMKYILMLEMEIARLEMKYDVYKDKGDVNYLEGLRSGGRLYKMKESCLEHCLNVADICAERRDNNPNMVQIVEQVKELVEQKLTDRNLSVNSIGQEIYLSVGYVRTIFKEVTGQTLSGYIISRKLAMICRLLRETDWSVQRIADHMDFSSRSYLYTFFKNYMGMTPNQYRKEKDIEVMPVIPEEETSGEEG